MKSMWSTDFWGQPGGWGGRVGVGWWGRGGVGSQVGVGLGVGGGGLVPVLKST